MVIFICPRCQTRLVADKRSGDYIHECNSGVAVRDEDDVLITTTTVDEFGNPNKSTGKLQGDIIQQGSSNKVWGQRAWVEGEKVHKFTVRGNIAQLNRQRQALNYIPNVKDLSKR